MIKKISINKSIVPIPKYFYSLDIIRGIAALSVVFYHWQHFFFLGNALGPFSPKLLPFYSVFAAFYNEGWRAVEFFFCMSGFVFFWLYSQGIANRTIGSREFWLLRFSRLYPLHFITLTLVAVEQIVFRSVHSSYFVYQNNDIYHFILQLFFASSWGLEHGLSFNGPTWSVSVEILLYIIFFMLCYTKFTRWWNLLIIVALGYLMISPSLQLHQVTSPVGRGLFSFFVGTLAFKVFDRIRCKSPSYSTVVVTGAGSALMWSVVPYVLDHARHRLANSYFPGARLAENLVSFLASLVFEVILFPCSIIALALLECYRGTLGKRLSWIGSITYSSYLIHFPLQLLFLSIILWLVGDRSFFYSKGSLVLFFACLIPLSLASYKFIERPTQRWLRKKFTEERTISHT